MNKPVIQGDLDGTCGFYSIINALELLFPRAMNDKAKADMLRVIMKALPQVGWPEYILDGTVPKNIEMMLDAAMLDLPFKWERPFRRTKFADFDEFHRELKWRIQGDECFAIVGMSKPWEHWTVVHRFTQHEIIMTDSCHVKQIPISQCSLSTDHSSHCTYELDANEVFTLMKIHDAEH